MATTLGIRGFNPLWAEFDLAGNIFDDTYYMWVLSNEIPYIPIAVFSDPNLSIPLTDPIQFLGNGTLPVDIYWDPNTVYRLEFRQHIGLGAPTQSDPLIYLVENYTPGNGGGTVSGAFASENQITNPQFSLVDFSSPYMFTGAASSISPIDIAPGWSLVLAGNGTITLNQVPLNNTNKNPSNAPYALEITLSGWNAGSVFLIQKFDQNGMLWANKSVSNALTARLGTTVLPQLITGSLFDSNGTPLATVLSATVTASFNEFTGVGTLPDTSNPDTPPAASIQYQLALPSDIDIYLTSFQLIVQEKLDESEPVFIQDSIDRQIDHTFHWYYNSLVFQPKDSLLSGWDFGLNPYQYWPVSGATITSQCAYTADQTIIYQHEGANEVAVSQSAAVNNFGFNITAVGNSNTFAMIQYIDPLTLNDIWGTTLSSLVQAKINTSHGSSVQFKMRLIWRSTLPSTIGNTEPISSWTGTDPVFSAGWTQVIPDNDPVYTLGSSIESFVFEGMSLASVPVTTSTMTLGIVIYTISNMSNASPADSIIFNRVSLVPNQFAIDSSILTFNDTLRRLYYYFESSKNIFVQLTTNGKEGALIRSLSAFTNGVTMNIDTFPLSFNVEYREVKRNNASFTFYNEGGLKDNVTVYIRDNGSQLAVDTVVVTNGWNSMNNGNKGIQFLSVATTMSPFYSHSGATSNSTDAFISFHYSADSRLGV